MRLFPDDEDVALPDDPDVVRVRLRNVGWTNARSFGDVWLARWLWHYLAWTTSLPVTFRRARKKSAPLMSWPSRSSIGCAPRCSEFAIAEHWYARPVSKTCLGVPDSAVTKDRLYRTLDALRRAQVPIEKELKERLGTLFGLDYDILLYDLTSSYFEGLAEGNDLAERGYSRDHRSDCSRSSWRWSSHARVFPWRTKPSPATRVICTRSGESSPTSKHVSAKASASGSWTAQ